MKYELIFSDQSKDYLSRLKKDEPQAFRKASRMLLELMYHPTTGRPELLKGSRSGQWSRRISQKHRLVYEILSLTTSLNPSQRFNISNIRGAINNQLKVTS